MKSTGLVLLYNMTPARLRQIIPICLKFGIRIKKVASSEYGQKIGALAGRDGFEMSEENYTGQGFEDEMLVMEGFSRQLLDNFLNAFRQNKVPRVALKAVITDHNCEWDSLTLHEEISREHEAMKKV